MAFSRRIRDSDSLYFVTLATVQWVDVLPKVSPPLFVVSKTSNKDNLPSVTVLVLSLDAVYKPQPNEEKRPSTLLFVVSKTANKDHLPSVTVLVNFGQYPQASVMEHRNSCYNFGNAAEAKFDDDLLT